MSIGAWFEASIEEVTRASKGQTPPTKGKVGRPSKRTNGKLEAEPGQAQSQGQTTTDSNGNNVLLNSDSCGASTSQTDSTTTDPAKGSTPPAIAEAKERDQDVIYHIKYDE